VSNILHFTVRIKVRKSIFSSDCFKRGDEAPGRRAAGESSHPRLIILILIVLLIKDCTFGSEA